MKKVLGSQMLTASYLLVVSVVYLLGGRVAALATAGLIGALVLYIIGSHLIEDKK